MIQTGSYGADLLGSIASNLAGLQGYDVMALELIQNADDARAKSIVFNITEEALIVTNDAKFSYCGDLSTNSCSFDQRPQGSFCDFHRITKVASGGKARDSQNIGRFGIGFVSTYQICDYPQIESAGVALKLIPDREKRQFEETSELNGTRFVLPWATDPNSPVRIALRLSAVEADDLDRLEKDITRILDKALLFLQNVNHAELRRNDKLICSCKLTRDKDNLLIMHFAPDGREEMWLTRSVDANKLCNDLKDQYPRLETDRRRTIVSIAYRLDPTPLENGLFYAFLPTEQSLGLPLHINADFYPEADRKNIIFSGEKHQQHWNVCLLAFAATHIAEHLETLKSQLGASLIWKIIQGSWQLSQTGSAAWQTLFWATISERIDEKSELAWTCKKKWAPLGKSILPHSDLSTAEEQFISNLGLEIVNEDIVQHAQQVLQKLGAKYLTLKRLSTLVAANSFFSDTNSDRLVANTEKESTYLPLWQLIDRLIDKLPRGQSPHGYFDYLPILLTSDQRPVRLIDGTKAPDSILATFKELLPELNLVDSQTHNYMGVSALVRSLTLEIVVKCLTNFIKTYSDSQARFGTDPIKLHELYRALSDPTLKGAKETTIEELRGLPIYLTGRGYRSANKISLPGNFNDPIGVATILSRLTLDPVIEEFFSQTLGIERLELSTYITTVLPRLFRDDEVEAETINLLLRELAKHPSILDNFELTSVLSGLPLIPTQDGGWHSASQTYYKTHYLVESIGDNPSNWIDDTRLDPARSTHAFVQQIGLASRPSVSHLTARIIELASEKPSKTAHVNCEKTFYAACELFDGWTPSDRTQFVDTLASEKCLPAHEDFEEWHDPENLYAPYRLDAFSSQADILPFRNLRRLNAALLKTLKIVSDPETELVIAHLNHCIDNNLAPSRMVYQILNERCSKPTETIKISQLTDVPSIYDESRKRFLRPNQLFWTATKLGDRALKVPIGMLEYRRLFDELGVKDSPTPNDHLDIATDIIEEYGDTGQPVLSSDLSIYRKCLDIISEAITHGDTALLEKCRGLQMSPCILNLDNRLCCPDEIAIRDSDWHESHFGDALRGMLSEYQAEWEPLYRATRVRSLSQVITPEITQKCGDKDQEHISQLFRTRAFCVLRVLHDRPRRILVDLRDRLQSLHVVLCDILEISFSCDLIEPALKSPEHPTVAHYDSDSNRLYLTAVEIGEFSIPAFNSILHILATSATGASIPNLVLNCEMILAANDAATADRKLTSVGFPEQIGLEEDELEGGELGELGTATDTTELGGSLPGEELPTESSDGDSPGKGKKRKAKDKTKKDRHPGGGTGKTTAGLNGGKSAKKKRGQKRRDRLLSYVLPRGSAGTDKKPDPSVREHNLSVEDKGRAAVVLFEKERGRDAIPQAQENPGWDIISTDVSNGAIRYIEVKAIDGEWTKLGVGLSRLQFHEAWNRHDDYWLYVVEFAGDDDKEGVYPIQSPATKVTSFMFDHNWRDIADIEVENPHAAFQVDATIDCGLLGIGRITDIQEKGRTKLLTVDFGRGKTRSLTLNVARMSVIEEKEI